MVKLVVAYRHPVDPAAFDKHYMETHMPIVRQWPGVVRTELAWVKGAPGGQPSPLHLIAEIYFQDMDALNAALSSPAGRAAGKDIMSVARDILAMHIAEVVQ